MGGASTSHSVVLNGKKTNESSDFDLRSWQGLTQVLKTAKDALEPPQYSEFRNLVLEYAQQGGSPELRSKIDGIIATFGAETEKKSNGNASEIVERVPSEKNEESKPTFGTVGTRRIQPRFHVVTEPATHAPAPEVHVVPMPSAISQPVSVPVPEVEKVPEPVVYIPVPEPEKTVSAPQPFKTLDEYKARITEIKRLVNAQVGNPATLIDTHNTHGKEYMTALLTALKATGGGGSDGVDGAMAKLEEAYVILLNDKDVAEEPPVVEERTPEVVIREVAPEVPAPAVIEEEAVKLETLLPQNVDREEVYQDPEPVVVRDTSTSVIQRTDEKILSVVRDMQKDRPAPLHSLRSLMVEEGENTVEPEIVPSPQKKVVRINESWQQNKHVFQGIGKHTPEEIREESGVDTAQVISKQTELSSPEITKTLQQLIHEWSIFHGSGLFGFGPSGPEHPLYQTLAPLSMGEVIAGRWEGSNHKLTKTIKQYVDAWRHEQGIAYVINETFEHYLRRVVQRILKQKKLE